MSEFEIIKVMLSDLVKSGDTSSQKFWYLYKRYNVLKEAIESGFVHKETPEPNLDILREAAKKVDPEKFRKAWPKVYHNRVRNFDYIYRNDIQKEFTKSYSPRHVFVSGGEGSGKSALGVIKTLEKLRHGMSGAMLSPTFPEFKRSLWAEFTSWVPVEAVIPEHKYMVESSSWQPQKPFKIYFYSENGTLCYLSCSGLNDPRSQEGQNLNFVHIDEPRGLPDNVGIQTMMGRLRVKGPNGEEPQIYLTGTPGWDDHWLFDYFGNLEAIETYTQEEKEDPENYYEFKKKAQVIRLRTMDNDKNGDDYYTSRASGLDEKKRLRDLEGQFVSRNDFSKFMESPTFWANCAWDKQGFNEIPKPHPLDRMVIALDAAVRRDHFALALVGRDYTTDDTNRYIVYQTMSWEPGEDGKIAHIPIEKAILALCEAYNVICITYDETQLHYMTERLRDIHGLNCKDFPQTKLREVADTALYNKILDRRIIHLNDEVLTKQVNHAAQTGAENTTKTNAKRLRIVKPSVKKKVDILVTVSMAVHKCSQYDR